MPDSTEAGHEPNRIALVTGGSRGLGPSTAINLARRGVDVIITYHANLGAAEATVASIRAAGRKSVALRLDSGEVAGFDGFATALAAALKNEWQRDNFDYLVNNAGTGLNRPFAETAEAEFDQLCNVHFKGVYFLTQKLLPLIADGGRIVNLSSGLARFSLPGHSAYASMKGAVEVLTRYLAKELGPRRITVNSVAPGAIATDFGGGAVRDNPELSRLIASQTPLGRIGVPEDIGPMIASLLSDDNRWINGQRIEVSGGINL